MLVTSKAFRHDIALRSAYPVHDRTPTFAVSGAHYRLDHVLASPTLVPRALLEIQPDPDVLRTGLPTALHPSDHLPVGAVLQLV